ncbi:MAG: hypothetical protein IT454_23605, partial [Planctomycetes bacterium]|nr:hypothetical protein [Planctomycetota bacterium]
LLGIVLLGIVLLGIVLLGIVQTQIVARRAASELRVYLALCCIAEVRVAGAQIVGMCASGV